MFKIKQRKKDILEQRDTNKMHTKSLKFIIDLLLRSGGKAPSYRHGLRLISINRKSDSER